MFGELTHAPGRVPTLPLNLVWNRERGENTERKGVLSPLPPRNSLKKWWAVKDSNLGPAD